MADAEDLTEVTHTLPDGKSLTGVGVEAEDLAETMARFAPDGATTDQPTEDVPAADTPETTPQPSSRNEDGTFKKQSRGARRFDQLTGEKKAAQERADAAERRNTELLQRIEALERQGRQPAAAPAREQAPPVDDDPEPLVEQFTADPNDPDPYLTWNRAHNKWAVRQGLKDLNIEAAVRRSIEADAASRSFQRRLGEINASGVEAYPDFDAVLNNSPLASVQFPPHFKTVMTDLAAVDGVEHVIYALAKDETLLNRLMTIKSPAQLGVEFAKLIPRERVGSPAATARGSRTTEAPAPIQPVGGGSKTTSPPLEDVAASGDYAAYKARRHADLKAVAHHR